MLEITDISQNTIQKNIPETSEGERLIELF